MSQWTAMLSVEDKHSGGRGDRVYTNGGVGGYHCAAWPPQRDNDKLTVLSKSSQAITSVWASGFTTCRGQRAAEGLLGGNNRSKIILHPVVVETVLLYEGKGCSMVAPVVAPFNWSAWPLQNPDGSWTWI